MARNYANIFCAIWRQGDFCALTAATQRVYLLLVTQPDISAAGVLPLSVQRWSKRATDTKPADIRAALVELQKALFVVVDGDTEEVFVRTFVKWDGGYSNRKRRPVIIRAAEEVESPAIRRAMAAEFAKLGLPIEGLADSQADSLSGSLPIPISKASPAVPGESRNGAAGDIGPEDDADLFSQANSLSDTESDTESPSDGVVVTQGLYIETSTRNPQTVPPSAGAAKARPARRTANTDAPEGTTTQTLLAEWLEKCRKRPPGQVVGHVSKVVKRMLEEGVDPDDIRRGLEAWQAKGQNPSALPSFVNQVANAAPSRGPSSGWAPYRNPDSADAYAGYRPHNDELDGDDHAA